MSLSSREAALPPENLDALRVFVGTTLGTSVFKLTPHSYQGYTSRTYACDTESARYILRHNKDKRGMAKDAYAARHFRRPELPIPAVIGIGNLSDASVLCLSERMPGKMPDDTELSTPGTPLNRDFAAMLRTIHTTDISAAKGYGFVRDNGRGLLPRFLAAAGVQRIALARLAYLYAAQRTSLERGAFRDIAALQRSLGGFCVTERALCQGDPKSANLLAEGGCITGVIDWDRFEYNDPALDLGILHARHPGAIDPFAHARAIGLRQEGLKERVLYYAMNECAIAIAFFGRIGVKTELATAEQRLVQIAHEASTG